MITDIDILAGILEAGRGSAAWAAVGLEDPAPPAADIAEGMKVHFGVTFAAGELEAITTVRGLVELLRRKFDEE